MLHAAQKPRGGQPLPYLHVQIIGRWETLTRTSRRWNSGKTDAPPTPHTYTNSTDTPFRFTSGSRSHLIFSVDSQGVITLIVAHGCNPLTGKNLPPEGRVIYPTPVAPSIVHYLP